MSDSKRQYQAIAQASQASELEQYQRIFHEMLNGFALHEVICDADGKPCDYRFLQVNPAFEKFTGLVAGDIIGKTVLEVLPDTETVWIEKYGHVALTGEELHFTQYSQALNKYFEVSAFSPQPGQFATTFVDVSDSQRLQQAAEHREAHYRRLVEDIPLMICRFLPDSTLTFVNQAYAAYFNSTAEALLGTSFLDLIPDSEHAAIMAYLGSFAVGHSIQVSEHQVLDKYQQKRWQRWTDRAFFDKAGHILEFQSIGEDITEIKHSQHALKNSEVLFRQAFDNASIGIVLVDLQGKITRVNEQLVKMLGYQTEQIIGMHIKDVTYREDWAHSEALVKQLLNNEIPHLHVEKRYRHKNSQIVWGETTASLVFDEDQKPLYLISHIRDVTERKNAQIRLEQELKLHMAQAELYQSISASNITLEEIAKLTRNLAQRLTQSMYGCVGEIDAKTKRLTCHSFDPPVFNACMLNPLRQSFFTNTPHVEQQHQSFKMLSEMKNIQALLSVPVLLGEEMVGQITLANPQHPYSTEDVTTIERLAEFYALAIQQRRESFARSRSEQRYQMLVENLPDIVYTFSKKYGAMYWSPQVQEILGYTPEDLLKQPFLWHESIHPDDVAKVNAAIQGNDDGLKRGLEYRIRDKAGDWHWFHDRFVGKFEDDDGIMIEGLASDITVRKETEMLLHRLATIVEQAPVTIVMTGLDANIVYANPYFEEATGYKLHEVLHKNPRILQSGLHDKAFYKQMWQTLLQGRTWHGRFTNKNKSGALYHEAATVFPIKNEHGDVINYAAVKQNISEQVKVEEALKEERTSLAQRVKKRTVQLNRSNAELARAVRLKDEFLANMSHELRTPLNAILTLSEVLEETLTEHLNPKQQKYFRTLRDSGEHLLSLINDILDISKIEAGAMTLEVEKIQISQLCDSCLALIKQLAQKKDIHLHLNRASHADWMYGDIRRIKQMLVNLLSNAVKFTPEGGEVKLIIKADQEHDYLTFSVCDTGIGIAQEDIARLFKPFTQLDSGLDRQYAGSGLGLALVAKMAALHGGSVSVDSELNTGSCFTLSLPWHSLKQDSDAKDPTHPVNKQLANLQAPQINGQAAHVLVVDDTQHVLELLSDYLRNHGYQVTTAMSGRQALDILSNTSVDIILMDINMPDMDGYQTTQSIRQEPGLSAVPIIAVTALAMPGDKEHCLAVGMQDYLSKPVSLKKLLESINQQLAKSSTENQMIV
jgi:PAS domain S-box-containing protein